MEHFRLTVRILASIAVATQLFAYGPSPGLAITHGIIMFAIWFNRERKK